MRHPASTIFSPQGGLLTHPSFALSFKSTDVQNPCDLASTRSVVAWTFIFDFQILNDMFNYIGI